MEIYVCITLLAVIAIVAVLLATWRRPGRKVVAMLIELVRQSHEALMAAESAARPRRMTPEDGVDRRLPRHLAADVAAHLAGQEAMRGETMADDLDAQSEAEQGAVPDQPGERARF